ncbi:hypothetical protein V8C44DRAFT_357111 [Trichoderma aethiopicum]
MPASPPSAPPTWFDQGCRAPLFQERKRDHGASTSHTTANMIESCTKPTNFGRGAYDTTGLPKPPPPQPQ